MACVRCMLRFTTNLSGAVGLVISAYSLQFSLGHEWQWREIIITISILTTIVTNSIREALDENQCCIPTVNEAHN